MSEAHIELESIKLCALKSIEMRGSQNIKLVADQLESLWQQRSDVLLHSPDSFSA